MTQILEYELARAAHILVNDQLHLQKGETVMLTADTQTDPRLLDAVAGAAHTAGAIPMVVNLVSPMGVGKAADPMLPVEPLAAALSHTDAWVEFNTQWLLYSTPFERAMAANKKLRYMCLCEMTVDMMVRLIGRIDAAALSRFMRRVAEMNRQATSGRITTPSGQDISFKMLPKTRPVSCDDGLADKPGMRFLAGQITIVPDFDSINGTLVFDGTIAPPVGFLKEPVVMDIAQGRIAGISGGPQADEFRAWLDSFNDPAMFRLAHCSYGFNPGARLTGICLEDERVWGATEWGIGYLHPVDAPPDGIQAPSHCDGICLKSSVWLDGVQILDEGVVVHPDLVPLAEPLIHPR